jgi:uncharacterized membrane protein
MRFFAKSRHKRRRTTLARFSFVRRLSFVAMLGCAGTICATAARADLQMCNATTGRVGVSIGYKDADGNWITEGWWNLPPHVCESVLKGTLAARFYYVYAIDYDKGGEWAGQAYMCTREKEFTIRGIDDCLARGFDRTGFYEIDTGEQRSWTIQLNDAAQLQPQTPTGAVQPMIPILPGRQGPPVGPMPGLQNR